MTTPKLKTLMSADLERPDLPDDPGNCEVFVEATIGPDDSDAAEIFAFTVATPAALTSETRFRWGRGLLIVPSFSWDVVDLAVARLLAQCCHDSWAEVAHQLNQNLYWEFEKYRDDKRA